MDLVFNIAKGRTAEKVADGANLIVVLLRAAQADGVLRDHDTLAALLAATGNTEANFTNYSRKTIANAALVLTVDNTNDRTSLDTADLSWASAGGATNNSLVKALVCEDVGGADTSRVPLLAYDYPYVTSGTALPLVFHASGLLQIT